MTALISASLLASLVVAAPAAADAAPEPSATPSVTTAPAAHVGGYFGASVVSPPGAALSYQWYSDGEPLPFGTTAAISPSASMLGSTVYVTVTETMADGSVTTVSSSPAPVLPGTFTVADPGNTEYEYQTVGYTLHVDPGTWSPTPSSFAYQWVDCGPGPTFSAASCTPIDGATSPSFTITEQQFGEHLAVDVTAALAGYAATTKMSAIPGAVALVAAQPSITGDAPATGNTVTANPGTWAAGAQLSYQWIVNGVPVTGATGTAFTLPGYSAGTDINVRVTGTLDGHTSTVSSPGLLVATSNIGPGTEIIAGSATVGHVLTATTMNGWTTGTTLTYQWYDGAAPISGATAKSFVIPGKLYGHTLFVRVTGTLQGYRGTFVDSPATAPVAAGTLTSSTPKITGTVKVGYTLTANPGSWTTGTAFRYQWYANGAAISGATGKTLALTAGLRTKTVYVRVSGSQTGYATAAKSSAVTAKVATGTLSHSGTPVITGTAAVGHTLATSKVTWTAGTSVTCRWYVGAKLVHTGTTYTVAAAYRGHAIVARVTGAKTGYSTATLTTKASAVVR